MQQDIVNFSYKLEVFESKKEHNRRIFELIDSNALADVIHNGFISDIDTKLFGKYRLKEHLKKIHTKDSIDYKTDLINRYGAETFCLMYKINA